MKYVDDYMNLYHSDDEWYLEYIDRKLKKIKRQYNENQIQKCKNQK